MKRNTEKILQEESEQYEKARATYLELFSRANTIQRNKPDWNLWSSKELTTVLNTYKRKTDGSLPKRKAELAATYQVWSGGRMPFSFREYCVMHNKKIPEGQSGELDISFESDSDEENIEHEVAASLLELAGAAQSD